MVDIKVAEQTLSVEFAKTWDQRRKGLMNRKSLCQKCGMLFQFEEERVGSMWMKNTYIPLDIAFISRDGTITDIKSGKPHDLTPIRSSQKILYALEMNLGWFARHQVSEGDKVVLKSVEGKE